MNHSSKKLVVLLLIIVMVGLPSTLHNVAAMGPSGKCWCLESYQEDGSSEGTCIPNYCECEHSAAGWFDDMMAGIGVEAFYTPDTATFSVGRWDFVVEAGRDFLGMDLGLVSAVSPAPACYFIVDYSTNSQYSEFYSPQCSYTWANGYDYFGTWNGLGYYSEITDFQAERSLSPARISLEGVTMGTFLMASEPWWYYYEWAYTHSENPNVPVDPFAFLTAHVRDWGGDWSAV